MMRWSIWCLLLVSLAYTDASVLFPKTIEKRQICNNNNCSPCDGQSCNSCNNNVCCTTVTCNSCVSQCNNDCTSVSCRQNCVSGCSNTCQNQNCIVPNCSQCVNRCSNSCSTSECLNDCCNRCDCTLPKPERLATTDRIIIIETQEPTSVVVNNTNHNLVNLTTQVNINNVIHTFNNISVPVFINTTNINNINLNERNEASLAPYVNITTNISNPSTNYTRPIFIYDRYPGFATPIRKPNCCYVLHPKQCYIDGNGQKKCVIRRRRECSELCTAPVVTIETEERESINTRRTGCQFIRQWPYLYCGNYIRGNCDQCYGCGASWNPDECFRQNGCSESCRRSAPSCAQTELGPQCY